MDSIYQKIPLNQRGDGIIEFCSIHGIKSKFMKIIAKSDGSESESPVFDANSMKEADREFWLNERARNCDSARE